MSIDPSHLSLDLPKATSVVRIHRTEYDPVFFSPGSGNAPIGRFDIPSGAFGVLYLAQALEGAFAETILRNPQRRLVDLSEITARAASVLGFSRAMRLVKMFGAGLQSVRTDNGVSTGPYGSSGMWADTLFAHPDTPDGIAHSSRHGSEQLCIALFSRPDIQLELLSGPTPLSDVLPDVASILRRYGKGIATRYEDFCRLSSGAFAIHASKPMAVQRRTHCPERVTWLPISIYGPAGT